MTREELIEVMARAIAPRCWEVMDAELNRMLQKYKGQEVAYPSDQFQHKESMATARKALLALEAAGVRLVPEQITPAMHRAGMNERMRQDGREVPGDAASTGAIYTALLAASPYAPPGG